MKKLQFGKTSSASKLKNKGFYAALGLCVIAIGVAVYVGLNSSYNNIVSDDNAIVQNDNTNDWNYPDTADVNINKEDVPVEDNTSSLPMAEENVSEEDSSQEEQEASENMLFLLPVQGEIINEFSGGELVKSKTLNEWRTHDGVDIKATANTVVKAAGDGVVEDIKEDSMWGVCVIISHPNDYTTYYYGLKPTVSVTVGQEVKISDEIGAVGNTAEIEIAEESHLHFAMKKGDEWIDPLSMVPQL